MNKKIKRLIALTLTLSAFSVISAITPGTALDITTKAVYAASYSPDDEQLKTLSIKSTEGETIALRDGYNGSTVKLSDDTEYYAKLTDDSDGIKIKATVEGDGYIVRIFISDKADATAYEPGDEIPLGKGNTTIYVRTYESASAFRKAKDTKKDVGICEEEYEINLKKTTESSYEDNTQDPIYLDNIDISRGKISFIKQKTSYDMEVASDIDSIRITAVPEDDNDRVRINGKLVDSEDKYRQIVDLDEGDNEIKVKVTDDKDNQRTYTLNITRGDSSDTQDDIHLNNLTISEGEIDFSEDETSYDVDLDESVDEITIGAEPEDEEYLVTIDGDEVNSGDDYEQDVSLVKGKNTIKVVIEDELNDKKRTYTLTINRGEVEDTDDTDVNTGTTGWIETEDGWIYKDENGEQLKKSWLYDKDEKVYCYLDADGLRVTGWFKDDNKWYLLDKKGAMLTGWQYTDGKWYVLDQNGAMKTGWYNEKTIVQDDTANTSKDTTATNDVDVSKDTNTSKDVDTDNTTNTTKTKEVDNWYYLNDDGSMKIGWLLDGGKWYYFNTNGAMQKGWLINSNSKYYLNADGTMTTGTQTIAGKEYKFTNNGVLII